MKFSRADEYFTKRCLELAKKGEGFVSPNPMVGCVIVKGGKILAEGFHKKFGEPHAEVNALRKCRNPQGTTLYLNLEPCCHFGKTPPCTKAIIASGVQRVVVGSKDPNPVVFGKGIQELRKAGVRVDIGCLQHEAEMLNEKFFHWIKIGQPFVTLKIAMSLDGKIATRTGDSKWITSEPARHFVKRLRDQYDAILVGVNTVLRDNPTLAGTRREPWRIILDSKLRSPLNAHIFRDNHAIMITTSAAPKQRLQEFKKKGIPLKVLPRIRMNALLHFLGNQNISSLLVEGGSRVFTFFLEANTIQQFLWFVAPKIIAGEKSISVFRGRGPDSLAKSRPLKIKSIQKIGPDIFIESKFLA